MKKSVFPLYRIKDIGKVVTGTTPSTTEQSFWGGSIPFVTPTDITENRSIEITERTVTEKGVNKERLLPKDSVLVTCIASVGKMTMAAQPCITNQQINALICYPQHNPVCIYYVLLFAMEHLKQLAGVNVVPIISKSTFEKLQIALPPPNEQAAIARILDAVDTAIERAREAVGQAKELKFSLIQDFFYLALGVTAYADRPTKNLPVGWNLIATKELLAEEPKNGVSPRAVSNPPGVVTFSIAAVRDSRVELDKTENIKYVQLSEKIATQYKINRGDMLIVRGNANADLVGKAGIVDSFPDGCIYPDITKRVVFKQNDKLSVTSEYAVLAWNHPILHNQILRRAKTSNGTLKINSWDVKQIVMPVPPKEEQTKIIKLVSAVDAKIKALNHILWAYETLKKSLLHDLLTGQVRVNPALLNTLPEND